MSHRRRGQEDALKGRDRNYGCHFGMKSTLWFDRAQYYAGYDEVEFYLNNGDRK